MQKFACTSTHSLSYTHTRSTHACTHARIRTHTHVVTFRYTYYVTCTRADSSTFTCKQTFTHAY